MTKEDLTKAVKTTAGEAGKFIVDNKHAVAAAVVSAIATEAIMKGFRKKSLFPQVVSVITASFVQVALMHNAEKLDKNKN